VIKKWLLLSRAYFVYPIVPGIVDATAYFAQAAKEATVSTVVNMSQVSARREAKSHAAFNHWMAERVFDWSGLTVCNQRFLPNGFFTTRKASKTV
jgi:NAD(P)H dehydrogenase (quinone)